MRLALVEVYEVASFYAHFDIVMDDEPPPPPVTVRVCDSLTCALMGAERLLGGVARPARRRACASSARPAWAAATTRRSPRSAMRCTSMRPSRASPRRSPPARRIRTFPAIIDFDRYRADGGYPLLAACLAGKRPVEDIIKTLEDSDLRGLGGAGFPTGRKWRFVRAEPAPRLMAVNADEGEPGTFKDRYYLETDPHRFLEGMLIAAWAVEADGRLHLSARRVPAVPRDPAARDRAARGGRPVAPHDDPSAPRRRRLHLRRGIGDARKHRGQARAAAPQAAVSRPRSGCSAGRR